MPLNRREVMGVLGGMVAGGLVMSAAGTTRGAVPRTENPGFNWEPRKLDPAESAKVAYARYWFNDYGCCYGAFYSIVGVMAEKFGAPYDQFPFTMMEVGKSGISEWGTICGTLLGVASAYALFWGRQDRDPMVTELFRWYEQAILPKYIPDDSDAKVKGALPTSNSGSVLCHISASRWCAQSRFVQSSIQRRERCARVTADVSAKGIAILNAKLDGSFGPETQSKAVAACGQCHDKGMVAEYKKGLMDCTPCHGGSEHVQNKFKNHP